MNHDLKIDDVYLKAKLAGDKLFEIRVNDRGYQKGDTVTYREYFGGRTTLHKFLITYVCGFAQRDGFVVFGERKIETNSGGRDD